MLDTELLGAGVFGSSDELTLDALSQRLGVCLPKNGRHSALGDAKATAVVMIRLLQMLKGRGINTLRETIIAQQRHHCLLPDPNPGVAYKSGQKTATLLL